MKTSSVSFLGILVASLFVSGCRSTEHIKESNWQPGFPTAGMTYVPNPQAQAPAPTSVVVNQGGSCSAQPVSLPTHFLEIDRKGWGSPWHQQRQSPQVYQQQEQPCYGGIQGAVGYYAPPAGGSCNQGFYSPTAMTGAYGFGGGAYVNGGGGYAFPNQGGYIGVQGGFRNGR